MDAEYYLAYRQFLGLGLVRVYKQEGALKACHDFVYENTKGQEHSLLPVIWRS